MKPYRLILILVLVVSIFGCHKDETAPQQSFDPSLKASACDPSVEKIDQTDTLNYVPWEITCFDDEIIILDTLIIKTKGHLNISAGCRVNEHSDLEIYFTGTGMYGNYEGYGSLNSHNNFGKMENGVFRVERINMVSTVTNTTSNVTFTTLSNVHQVINANGDIVVDEIEFLPCQQ